MRGGLALAFGFFVTSSAGYAEPIDRWWSGSGMGVLEHGWSGSDRTAIYITCDGQRMPGLRVSIRGRDPKPKSDVIFEVNGQTIKFWTLADGEIEMVSDVSMNNLDFLFKELKSGERLIVKFNGISKSLPLKGSAKGLGEGLCE